MRSSFEIALCCGLALAAGVGVSAAAAETNFNIPPQRLSSALNDFGVQSGVQIVFASSIIGDTMSPGVVGRLAPDVALARLLAGTTLRPVHASNGFTIVGGGAAAHSHPVTPVAAAQAAPPLHPIRTVVMEPNAPVAVEEVMVTGSRIARVGFVAPTPLTILTADQLKASAPNDIADGLASIPAFRGASVRPVDNGSGSSNGNAGASLLSLRALGANRTLVLLDGRRVVQSNLGGSTDINLIPQDLVRSVEVVTGGASAAYGSDAVAGVVNFMLDTKYEGLKGGLQGGVSRYGDAGSYRANLTWGSSLLDGRGHLVAIVEAYSRDGIDTYSTARPWRNAVDGWVTNATGVNTPARVLLHDIHYSARSYGGLIVAGPLKGTDFGPGAVPRTFTYGTTVSANFMAGGAGPDSPLPLTPMGSRIDRATGFAHAEYDITEHLTAFIEGTAANSETPYQMQYNYLAGGDVITIFSGNPFLPAAIQQRMTAQNIESFTMGRVSRDMPINIADNHSSTQRLAAGLNGDAAGDWSYNLYYTHGQSHLKVYNRGAMNVRNIYAAADAVVNPANGQIVCRSTLAGLDAGCVPINFFGEGSVSAAATAFVTGNSYRDLNLKQDVAAAAFQGSLPDWAKLWATPASLAFGAEYRKESADQETDAISQRVNDFTGIRGGPSARSGALGGFTQSNFQLVSGSLDVKEAFVELALPVAANAPMVDLLEVNAAARITDYSTSGKVNTWKVGAVWRPVDEVWLRLTRSRDIRAPSVAELFSGGTAGNSFARDPVSGVTYPLLSFTRGNPNLTPENADTLTYGVVYEPPFAPGLNLSLDYYNISISGAIALLGVQVTIDECAKGSAVACEQVSFVNGAYRLNLIPLNLSSQINRGFDGEATYALPAFGGRLILRALANYTTKNQTATPGADPVDRAQEAGQLTATMSANFSSGALALNLQTRIVGEGLYNAAYVVGVDIDSNDVPSRTYTDLSVKYQFRRWGAKNEAFLTINNLFNQAPPVLNSMSSFVQESDYSKYDPIGTYVTAGIRFRY